MSKRLDQKREKKLSPRRYMNAKKEIQKLNLEISQEHFPKLIAFMHNDCEILLYPYSGWHTGKSIKDGRGLNKLLRQLV